MKTQPYISKFKVIKPKNEIETIGEILELSSFGEYCPEKSLRGYQLSYLLKNPGHYAIFEVVENNGVNQLMQ